MRTLILEKRTLILEKEGIILENFRKFWKKGPQILENRVLQIQIYHLIAVLQKLGAGDFN